MMKKNDIEPNLELIEEQELYPEPEEIVEDPVEEPEEEFVEDTSVRVGVVTPTHGLNIRQEPSIDAPIIEVLSKDCEVLIEDEVNDKDGLAWFKVITHFSNPGYCMKEFIEERS